MKVDLAGVCEQEEVEVVVVIEAEGGGWGAL